MEIAVEVEPLGDPNQDFFNTPLIKKYQYVPDLEIKKWFQPTGIITFVICPAGGATILVGSQFR